MPSPLDNTLSQSSQVRSRWLDRKSASADIRHFWNKFGTPSTWLACHAAFPSVVTPDLVNLIHINFLQKESIPWYADADFLLSPLCRRIGGNAYEVEPTIRELLLVQLERLFGWQRQLELAEFLAFYLDNTPDRHEIPGARRSQRWIALSYLNPDRAIGEMQKFIEKTVDPDPNNHSYEDITGKVHVATLVEMVAPAFDASLDQIGKHSLVGNARILAQALYGDQENLQKELGQISAESTNLSPNLIRWVVDGGHRPKKEHPVTHTEISAENLIDRLAKVSDDGFFINVQKIRETGSSDLIIPVLREALRRGKLVFVIGPDLSQELTGVKSRATFTAEFAGHEGLSGSASLAQTAELATRGGQQRHNLVRALKDSYDNQLPHPGPLYTTLARLDAQIWLSACYDNLLAKALDGNVLVTGEDTKYWRSGHPTVVRLVGDPGSIRGLVVLEKDYEQFRENEGDRRILIDFLHQELQEKVLLFLGFDPASQDTELFIKYVLNQHLKGLRTLGFLSWPKYAAIPNWGDNPIEGIWGDVTRLIATLQPKVYFEHGYALLIGVHENQVSNLALPHVANDIAALSAVLIHPNRCAYLQDNVRVLAGEQATKDNIMAGLAWLKEKLSADTSDNATALIYFSGHGVQDNSLGQPSHYLIPYDVNPHKLHQTALHADAFAMEIKNLYSQRLLVLLDCCHADSIDIKGLNTDTLVPFTIPSAWLMPSIQAVGLEATAKGLDAALPQQGRGWAVLNASRSDEKSYIRQERTMSIFTYHLIEALTGFAPHSPNDKTINIAALLDHIRKQVPKSVQAIYHAHQHPDGQVSGNFPISLLLGGQGVPTNKSLPDPLLELPTSMPEPHSQTLTEALSVIRNIQDERSRAKALNELAPDLPPELLPDALAVARSIRDEYCRADALIGLIPHLPSEFHSQTLTEALAAARNIKDEHSRPEVLASIASLLVNERSIKGMLNRGDLEGVMARYRQALEIKETLGDRTGVAATAKEMAGYLLAVDRYTEAVKVLEDVAVLANPTLQSDPKLLRIQALIDLDVITMYNLNGLALRSGDLIFTKNSNTNVLPGEFWRLVGRLVPGEVDHVVIYVGPGGWCVEAGPLGVNAFEVIGEKWMAKEMSDQRGGMVDDTLLGIGDPLAGRGLSSEDETGIRLAVRIFCLEQAFQKKPYNLNFLDPDRDSAFYNSQLAYKAYLPFGINLNIGLEMEKLPGTNQIVYPQEVWESCHRRLTIPESRADQSPDPTRQAIDGQVQENDKPDSAKTL